MAVAADFIVSAEELVNRGAGKTVVTRHPEHRSRA
jgi:hypothetical protein